MSSSAWQHLEDLFNEAVELPPHSRGAFLRRVAEAEPDVAAELRGLLESAGSADQILHQAVGQALVEYTSDKELPFLTLGPYRLLKEIGRGGMGAVYLAQREQHYEQQVAIKIVKRGMDSEFIVERFRHERQILARLNHPYIARMLDGGITPDGRPYLVMDYVEGSKVTTYCKDRNLNARQRIELFRRICEAVQFAHQNLVIHRDLKPGNILIEADGTPKLLDFGLAKLVESSGSQEQTFAISGGLLYTPGYASPEQAAGEPVSTATDTFALGAILFELLTLQPIRDVDSSDPISISRTIRERAVPRARSVAPNLDRDLDNILGKSLQQEPSRRYGTAEQLSEDLHRYLTGLPVGAVPDEFSYRMNKFLVRHRVEVAAAVLFVGALGAGLATTTWQARRAEEQSAIAKKERAVAETQRALARDAEAAAEVARVNAEIAATEALHQKSIAESEKVRAELRFNQVRQIAGTFLFDFHRAIQDLPGSLPARKMVVEKGLAYLDGLAKEGSKDPSFQFDLARAYQQIGDIQGEPALPNIGDLAGAMESYQKSLGIVDRLLKRDPSEENQRARFALVERLSRGYLSSRGIAKAGEILSPALEAAKRLYEAHPSDLNLFGVAMLEANIGVMARQQMKPDVAMQYLQGAAQKFRVLTERKPPYLDADARLAAVLGTSSDMQAALGHLPEAVALARQHLVQAQAIEKREPNNARHLRQLGRAYQRLGNMLGNPSGANMMLPEQSLVEYMEAQKIFDRLAAIDPTNATAASDQASAHRYLADIYTVLKRYPEAIAEFEIYSKGAEALSKRDPANSGWRRTYADSHSRLANTYLAWKKHDKSLEHGQKAVQILEALYQSDPANDYPRILQVYPLRDIGNNYQALGDSKKALEALDRSVGIAADMVAAHPASATNKMAWSEVLDVRAGIRAAAGLIAGAREDYRKSLEILEALDRAKQLPEEEKRTTLQDVIGHKSAFEAKFGK